MTSGKTNNLTSGGGRDAELRLHRATEMVWGPPPTRPLDDLKQLIAERRRRRMIPRGLALAASVLLIIGVAAAWIVHRRAVVSLSGDSQLISFEGEPLLLRDHDIILRGKVDADVYERVVWRIGTPDAVAAQELGSRFPEDRVEWNEEVLLSAAGEAGLVPVNRSYTAPGDGRLRIAEVQVMPRAGAIVKGRRIDAQRFLVNLACRPEGVEAVNGLRPPSIRNVEQVVETANVKVTVVADCEPGTFITVAVCSKSDTQFTPAREAKRVNKPGERLYFALTLGAEEEYEIRAYAAVSPHALSRERIHSDQVTGVAISNSTYVLR